ncbi:class I SAM-dependent methyltransferase [Flavicella marina]|uniref:class I SAM-dependent methyltransferase n=1 Tax=Flavicella marina TaxID=1475951 RepID=UPI0012651D41|nr:class I SAM-dependent methyltransferase [Flavicella marina]
MEELALIIDLFKNTERQGPGSQSDTLRALSFMSLPKDRKIHIADIGCGTGGQTLSLVKHTNSQISAVDLFPEFLDVLNENANQLELADNIRTINASMDALPFESESLDIIWSEGAIYNMGFEAGVKNWNAYLKKGGYLAVSEITWITNSRPKEIEDFWNKEYPEIAIASNKIKVLEENGFSLVGSFFLPEESWIQNYYTPLETKFQAFLNRHDNSSLAKKIVDDHTKEKELYLKFKSYYSYGFYIAKKE